MSRVNRIVNPALSYMIAVSLCLFLSLVQSSAAAEGLPGNAEDFRKLLESTGWKSYSGPNGSIYLYPADHPYAYLDQPSDGDWLDIPPPGSKALSEIVIWLESQGFNPIVEIEFEDGVWEVEAYKLGKPVEFNIDPVTGSTNVVPAGND